jgi:TolB protein
MYFSAISEGERYGVWAIDIDRVKGSPRGEAVSVANLGMASIRRFAVSQDGQTMVHTALATVSNLWTIDLDPATAEPLAGARPLTSGTGRNSRPAFSPDGASIAFDRWRIGVDQDIWLMLSDGSGASQLTTDPGADTQASWLPDNRTVVYLSSRNGEVRVATATSDGRDSATLTHLEASCDSVRVSPDGTRIAFHRSDDAGAINIWLADIDGGRARQITFDDELMGFPCWSPDGHRLAFERRRGVNDEVMVMEVGSDVAPRQLTQTGGRSWPYSWAPDGDKVAFVGLQTGRWNVCWVSVASGEIRQLTDFPAGDGYVRYPTWSPTGDRIVFERARTEGDLWVIEGLLQ